MGRYFSVKRNVELSVVQHIQDQTASAWDNITVVKAFLKAYSTTLPVISVRMLDTQSFRREVGSNSLRQRFTFIVDIFASSDGMRLDLADFIVDIIKDGCKYYSYSHNSASREILDKDEMGRITLISFDSDSRVEINSEASEHDKFRHSITFTMEKYSA